MLSMVAINNIYSQEEVVGSWIVSAEDMVYGSGYYNYQLKFTQSGINNPTDPELLYQHQVGNWNFPFSMGAYQCNGDLETYITGKYFYPNNVQTHWTSSEFGDNMFSEAQIISIPDVDNKYYLFYSNMQDGGSSDDNVLFYCTTIDVSTGEVDIDVDDFPFNINMGAAEYKNVAFAISNSIDDEKYIYTITQSGGLELLENYGLEKYVISYDGISYVETLLEENEDDFEFGDLKGYNLEMQNKNETDDPILAWINAPTSTNRKIFIYDPIYNEDDHYYLDFSEDNPNDLVETGRIAGIEFSPFADEEFYMYVSCEELGLIKIDWRTGELIDEYTQNSVNFSHSYGQTAPDGNVYVVSDDGTTFGMVSKVGNHEFNPMAFQYPFYVNQNGLVTKWRLTHINYKQMEEGGTKYFTLPENDQPFLQANAEAALLCDQNYGFAEIFIKSGVPDYELEVHLIGGGDVTGQFHFDPLYNSFKATHLPAGVYVYTVTDQGNCANGLEGTFSIGEGDAYDYAGDKMLEINSANAHYISGLGDLVWDQNDVDPNNGFLLNNTIIFKHGFRLNGETTLTINGLNLEFDEDYLAKVIIEPGSKLILNNCTLTNYHCSDPSAKWAGIEVWGNKDAPQTEANQGKLVMNNSTIEHAHEAVQLWNPDTENPNALNTSGGIITAINSNFKNNHRAVSFMSYKNAPFGLERNYDASFKFCNFINDAEYINDNPFYVFVSMWKVRGVQFTACDFVNSPAFPNSKAIYTLDAGYKLKGYCNGNTGPNGCTGTWITNTFTNFEKAIESANLPSDPDQYSINIWDSEFENNQYGVYMTTVNNAATILYNEFQIGNGGIDNFEKTNCGYFSTRGIQMNESFGFNIEENEFDKMQGTTGGDLVGVLVYKCPSDLDDIYKNQFNNLTAGNQADGVNRLETEDDEDGVTYLCNENTNNLVDIFVSDVSKINGHIGSVEKAAGNKFSSTNPQIQNDYTEEINYYWVDQPNEELEYFTNYVTAIEVTNANECLSNYGNSGGGIGTEPKVTLTSEEKQQVENEYFDSYQDYEAISELLEQLKDGGSTETTSLTIATAQSDDTWELRSNLLGMSPYLSKEVLMEAADRTDVLPESVLFEILSANPDELRKADLMEYLENKEQPLPNYMISILNQMATGISAKTALMGQKFESFAKKTKAAQKMILSIKNEQELDIVALRNWLGNMESIEADKQIVATYLYEDDYTNSNALLNMIPDLYDLQGEKLQEFNDYVDLLNLQIGLKQQNRNIFMLTESEKSQLLDFAENSTGDARSGARSILSFVYGNPYCDCITPIAGGGNKSSLSAYNYTNEDIAKAMGYDLNAKPNPTRVYSSVDYKLPINIEQAEIQLIDAEGKIVLTEDVTGLQGQITIDVRHFEAGTYIIRLISDKYSLTESIIIE